jgi:hypothetical protein
MLVARRRCTHRVRRTTLRRILSGSQQRRNARVNVELRVMVFHRHVTPLVRVRITIGVTHHPAPEARFRIVGVADGPARVRAMVAVTLTHAPDA